MGALMRSHAWNETPLGDPTGWSQSLRSAVSIMLNSRYPIALYWGPQLALLYNDDWSPIPGGKHPWALGRPGREVWPEIWETIGPLYAKVLSTGEGVWQQDELLPMLRHGYVEECYFNFTFSPVRGEDGRIDGIFNAVVETTDRVLSERRLRTLSRLGERADASISVEGACVRAVKILAENQADVPFAELYLREGDAVRLVSATISPDRDANARAPSDAVMWPLEEAEREGRAIVIAASDHPTATTMFRSEPLVEFIVLPIATAGVDRPAAFLVAGANPRRRIDASYRSFFDLAAGHLGTAIATARAYEDERRRAEALAAIDRAKTTFFSNVSHEFRTPLTLMIGPLEEALAEAAAPLQRERIQVAHRNALRLLRLVNSLLDFSRAEAGRIEVKREATELGALTADLAASFRSATDRAGLSLVVDTPPLSQAILVDRDMWEKIVLNLLSNAFKFTFDGEIRVELREIGDQAVLTVRDTGTGIPAGEIPKLFNRFNRVEGARSRSFEGSGIGLALVRELVELQGGHVEVESEEGRGTTFTVSLPLQPAGLGIDAVTSGDPSVGTRASAYVEEALQWLPGTASSVATLEGNARPTLRADEGGARVLLADDNADLRLYITRLLTSAGYDVETVGDGEAALAALRRALPDLVISDVMMPRLDGYGLLRAVRDDAEMRDLPVILLSARAGEEARVEGLGANADDYLFKPFSSPELLARVASNVRLARIRKASQAALRESEARFRNMADHAPVMIRVTDPTGSCSYLNHAWHQVTGRHEAEAEGLAWLAATHPDDTAETQRAFLEANADRAPFRIEYRLQQSDGSYRWVVDAAVPRFDAEGRFVGYIGTIVDVTEHKELEALLEQRVADAVADRERAEDALRQSQKMEAMGQLTGGVAHDFNNLLTPIVGALDLLQRKGLGGERERRLIAGAVLAAERAKTLVQRLLAFARRQPLQAVPVDIAKLVTGMADLIESTTGPQIRVTVEARSDLPAALADPNQLEMALLNLSVNARDAMPDGGTLRITASEERVSSGHPSRLRAGRYMRLSVADDGIGMDAATLQRAIEPFFSTKGIGKGTGLGLSMVHGLASQLGGALTIQSRRGVGTNIELWLPLSAASVQVEGAPPEAARLSEGLGVALLVDDEDLVRASTAYMLSDLGYRVVEAASAEDAIRLVQEGLQPDLLVTDHLMPGMTGTELARRLRAERPGIQVLLVSGYAEADGVAPDLPRLVKPFRNDDLAASLVPLKP